MGVRVRVDGLMVLAVAAVGTGAFLYFKGGKIVNAINPANPDNVVNTAVEDTFGEENVATFFDYVFGGVDLINPFNKSDTYAKQVWGLDDNAGNEGDSL